VILAAFNCLSHILPASIITWKEWQVQLQISACSPGVFIQGGVKRANPLRIVGRQVPGFTDVPGKVERFGGIVLTDQLPISAPDSICTE